MKITIDSTGGYESMFDYDSLPAVDQYTPEWSNETYALDLIEYPRPETHIPDWLRTKIANVEMNRSETTEPGHNTQQSTKGH